MERRTLREATIVAAALALGWWAHGGRPVQAASAPEDLAYQFSSLAPAGALTLWNPAERMLYVYKAPTAGNSHVSCTYRFHIGQPGQPIDRENCPAGSQYR